MSEFIEFLRDPMWQFVGVLAGGASIIVAIVIYLKQSGRKLLEYRSRSVPLLRIDTAIKDDVRISYRGEPVTDVNLVEVRLSNAGREPIQSADFESPIKIHFGDHAVVLGVEIAEADPPDLAVRCIKTPADPAVTITPLLLNPKDTFVVRCLVSGQGEVVLKARIAGVTRIENESPATARPSDHTHVLLLVGFSLLTEFLPLPFLGTLLLIFLWQRMRRETRELESTRAAA